MNAILQADQFSFRSVDRLPQFFQDDFRRLFRLPCCHALSFSKSFIVLSPVAIAAASASVDDSK